MKYDFHHSLLLTSTLHVCRVQCATKLVSESEDHISISRPDFPLRVRPTIRRRINRHDLFEIR